MNMDKEQELRNRILASDSSPVVDLPEYLVAQAAMRKPKPTFSFKSTRLAIGTGSVAAIALIAGLALPSAIAPQPLFTLAGGGGTMTSAESAPMIASDAKVGMAWPGYVQYNYLKGDLSKESSSGHIYQAQLVGDPKALLTQLMETFGVTGEIVKDEWSTDQNPSYSVQSKNGTVETYLSIYWSGTGSWNFSRWDSSLWACAGSAPVEESSDSSSSKEFTATDSTCNQPEPTPELIPSESEMQQQAADLFSKFGLPLDPTSFKTYRDDWGGSAYAELSYNGMSLPVSVSVGWDLRGELSYASGQSFKMVDRGEFKTISAFDAVDRIQEGSWYGSAPSSYYENQAFSSMARDSVAVAPAPAVDTGVATEGEAVAVEPTSEPGVAPEENQIAVDEPAPGDFQTVEPQIVDLTITKAESVILGVWDANGGFWLVPGYVLFNDQGWFDSIISVVEGVIELPNYNNDLIEPMPATKEG